MIYRFSVLLDVLIVSLHSLRDAADSTILHALHIASAYFVGSSTRDELVGQFDMTFFVNLAD